MNKNESFKKKLLEAIARSINTLDNSDLKQLITPGTMIGEADLDPELGMETTLEKLDELAAQLEASDLPFFAELVNLHEQTPEDLGVFVIRDNYPYKLITVNLTDDGETQSIYISKNYPNSDNVEGTKITPGFNAAKFEAKREITEKYRKFASIGHRPHFVGVLSHDQDPTLFLMVIEELTRYFEKSTFEVHVDNPIVIQNTDENHNIINITTTAQKALKKIDGHEYPCIGVMMGDICVRPAYRVWHPDDIKQELIQIGINPISPANSEFRLAS